MEFEHTNLIYFSPTKTTKKIVENVASQLQKETKHFDLTYSNTNPINFSNELVIIGTPVYGGRLPTVAVERLKQLKAENTLAILVAVYGNRDFEDALLELKNLVKELGFTPFAGAVFIGEHSYSTSTTPIAQNRPDTLDSNQAKEFAKKIQNKLQILYTSKDDLEVPGNFPYKDAMPPNTVAPVVNEELCCLCVECIDVCPTEAIYMDECIETTTNLCIRCSACIKTCPQEARVFESDIVKAIAVKLSTNCNQRKEPQFFI